MAISQIKPPMHGMGINTRDSRGLRTGLVDYWPMWSGSGDKAMDVSGANRPFGLVASPTWIGQGINFAGGNQHGVIANWPVAMDHCTFMVDQKGPGYSADDYPYLLHLETAGQALTIGLGGSLDAENIRWYGVLAGADGFDVSVARSKTVRQMYVGTYDRQTARLYINGAEVGTEADTAAVNSAVGGKLYLAKLGAGTERDWVGDIYSAAIWDRALSASEVAFLYRNPYALITRPDRLALWAAATAGGAPPAGLSIPIAMRHYLRMMGAA